MNSNRIQIKTHEILKFAKDDSNLRKPIDKLLYKNATYIRWKTRAK